MVLGLVALQPWLKIALIVLPDKRHVAARFAQRADVRPSALAIKT